MPARKQPKAWTKREVRMLGTRPDSVVATRTGRSVSSVGAMRRKLGIKSFGVTNSGVTNPSEWLIDWVRGSKTVSGERVDEVSAMCLAAYVACLKNISEDVGKLPFGMYEYMKPRGRKARPDHPVHMLLHDAPNPEMSAMDFRQTITAHALGYKGGFAEIVRDNAGVPRELWPLDPTSVQLKRTDDGSRRLYYLVCGVELQPESVLQIHGLGFDGLTGYVLSSIAKDVIGNAMAAQRFSGSFYANGTVSSGTIEVPSAMSETAFKHLRESFHERHGGAENQHKPIILEEGAKWNPTSSDPKNSQMLEVLQHGIEDVARLFRMPPHKIGHLLRSTNNNIEHQSLEYVQDTLLAWLVRWEQEVWRKLLLPRERGRLFAKHNVKMLLRGDAASQSTFYREMFNIGALSDNDIREYEDLNPIEGGDTYFVNAALVPLDMAATGEHMKPTQSSSKPDDEDDPAAVQSSLVEHKRELLGRVAAAHAPSLEDVIAGLLRIERDKVLRATKRPDFKQWADVFYGSTHQTHVFERLKPAVTSLYESLMAVVES